MKLTQEIIDQIQCNEELPKGTLLTYDDSN